MSQYIANKGYLALFVLLGVLHLAWGFYEWYWLFAVDRVDLAVGVVQFKARWTAPLLTALAMSAITLSYVVLRNPLGAMRMSLWYLYIAVLSHLGLLYFDPLRDYQQWAHWIPVVVLGILAYKTTKRLSLSQV